MLNKRQFEIKKIFLDVVIREKVYGFDKKAKISIVRDNDIIYD